MDYILRCSYLFYWTQPMLNWHTEDTVSTEIGHPVLTKVVMFFFLWYRHSCWCTFNICLQYLLYSKNVFVLSIHLLVLPYGICKQLHCLLFQFVFIELFLKVWLRNLRKGGLREGKCSDIMLLTLLDLQSHLKPFWTKDRLKEGAQQCELI